MLDGDGFLSDRATLGADINLLAYVLILLPLMGLGFFFIRKEKVKHHRAVMTSVTITNWLLFATIMAVSFNDEVRPALPERLERAYFLAPTTHAVLGLSAQLIATYLVIRMWFGKHLPKRLVVKNFKPYMRLTLGLWVTIALLGITTYYVWYIREDTLAVPADIGSTDGVPARRMLLQQFEFAPAEMTVPAGTAVTWFNQDPAPHNIKADDGSINSGNFFQGESYAFTFTTPGTYRIYCSLHGNAGGSGMSAVITVVEATTATLAESSAAPTPDTRPPTPTPAAAVALPPVSALQPADPTATLVGLLAFVDTFAPNDTAIVGLSGIHPPNGAELHAWLVGAGAPVDIGVLTHGADGVLGLTWTEPAGANLLARFDGVRITQEPVGDTNSQPGPVLYSGQQPVEALAAMRKLTASADTPFNAGYAVAARLQGQETLRHVEELLDGYEHDNLTDMRRHAEHIVNVLEGSDGEHTGDLDASGEAANPGDGFGVIPYIAALNDAAGKADTATDATSAIHLHAGHVRMSSDNALAWATALRDAALAIAAAQPGDDLTVAVEVVGINSRLLLNGNDANGDGAISPEEGGIIVAYIHAQYMAAIPIETVDATIGTPTGSPVASASPSGSPVATASAPGASDGFLTIEMGDFDYGSLTFTVALGTTVKIVNVGQAQHSATADDRAFDTQLLATGESVEITFDTPGTYRFYCLLHGAPGGVGMSATIIVE